MRLLFLVLAVPLFAACKHDDGMPTGTATIHSGSPEGPRVTSVDPAAKPSPVGVRADMGDRLAHAYCNHERACALGDSETKLLREDACFVDARLSMRASLDQWPCEPAAAKEGFDECLVAIRESVCSARSGEGAQIHACRGGEICRRSNVAAK